MICGNNFHKAMANNLKYRNEDIELNSTIMEKNYFTTLDADNKAELTWNYGELITAIETRDRFFTLFLLDSFFVETYVNKANKELEEIVIQDDMDVLYEYVKDLDLHALIQ